MSHKDVVDHGKKKNALNQESLWWLIWIYFDTNYLYVKNWIDRYTIYDKVERKYRLRTFCWLITFGHIWYLHYIFLKTYKLKLLLVLILFKIKIFWFFFIRAKETISQNLNLVFGHSVIIWKGLRRTSWELFRTPRINSRYLYRGPWLI